MRNPDLEPLDLLVGRWELTLTDAWFIEPSELPQRGHATARWLGDAFVELEVEMQGQHVWHFVFGRSDANAGLVALYHDPRPTSRVFGMTFTGDEWTLVREDPDFHQRFRARVRRDRIDGCWEASEDRGATWRKDFDLAFERQDDDATSDGSGRPSRMPGIARMRAVVLDCPDPTALAEFYRELVGGEIVDADDDWVTLRGEDVRLSFQRADGYAPPTWPSGERPQQFHIDVTVDDVDAAEVRVLAAGARKHDFQPGEREDWRVFVDPAGHPFCLCWD